MPQICRHRQHADDQIYGDLVIRHSTYPQQPHGGEYHGRAEERKFLGAAGGKHSPFGGIGAASAPLGSSWQDKNRSRTAEEAARKHPCHPLKTPARTAVCMRHATHCRMPALWHPCQRRFPRKLPNGGRSFCFAIIFSGLLPTRQPGFPTRAPLRLPPCCRLACPFCTCISRW